MTGRNTRSEIETMTFLDFPRNDFHKNHKMALSTVGRCSDTQRKMTTENGDRVVSLSSLPLEGLVSFAHGVLCGCDGCGWCSLQGGTDGLRGNEGHRQSEGERRCAHLPVPDGAWTASPLRHRGYSEALQ